MLFLVSDGVLAEPDLWNDFEVLLDLARRNKCYVGAQDDALTVANPWFAQASETRQEVWRNATDWTVMDASLYRLRTFIADTVSDPASTPPRVTLAEAIELAEQTAFLWVENGRNDRRFLLGMMPPEQREAFEEWEKRRVIEFKTGGGLGEARKAMEDLVARGGLDPRVNRALFDSDGEVPGHRSKDAKLMVDFCESEAIAYHCLDRRAIENYLPQKALWGWADMAGRAKRQDRSVLLEAFKRMNGPQRHHFHFKSGWNKAPSHDVKDLYASVPEADRDVLANGIDKDIAVLYDTYADSMHGWAEEEGIDPGLQATIDELTDWIRVPYA